MDYKITYHNQKGKKKTTIINGSNYLDVIFEFYNNYGVLNIIKTKIWQTTILVMM